MWTHAAMNGIVTFPNIHHNTSHHTISAATWRVQAWMLWLLHGCYSGAHT